MKPKWVLKCFNNVGHIRWVKLPKISQYSPNLLLIIWNSITQNRHLFFMKFLNTVTDRRKHFTGYQKILAFDFVYGVTNSSSLKVGWCVPFSDLELFESRFKLKAITFLGWHGRNKKATKEFHARKVTERFHVMRLPDVSRDVITEDNLTLDVSRNRFHV